MTEPPTDRNIRTIAQRVIEALGERLAGTWRGIT